MKSKYRQITNMIFSFFEFFIAEEQQKKNKSVASDLTK